MMNICVFVRVYMYVCDRLYVHVTVRAFEYFFFLFE